MGQRKFLPVCACADRGGNTLALGPRTWILANSHCATSQQWFPSNRSTTLLFETCCCRCEQMQYTSHTTGAGNPLYPTIDSQATDLQHLNIPWQFQLDLPRLQQNSESLVLDISFRKLSSEIFVREGSTYSRQLLVFVDPEKLKE